MAGGSGNGGGEQSGLTVGQLEASYPIYCKALKMLIQEEKKLSEIQRTVCWDRLEKLHRAMPRQYRDPLMHYSMLKRQIEAQGSGERH
ncbi:DUF3136 domain-containing protein [Synechococcus sp. CBW1004]|uniref:DUF3136 domain-containing protein n=1 Tax=Synechococcus sp. CBW1004 TaxID=1353136 RepID=UPI0018CDEB05|nr:DUF3136 domain-containing protein [Synechococcus sp. CBW1004]QPN64027.1 DUF3136 domain-containing protein [Synechococcus sp. CBW1004]